MDVRSTGLAASAPLLLPPSSNSKYRVPSLVPTSLHVCWRSQKEGGSAGGWKLKELRTPAVLLTVSRVSYNSPKVTGAGSGNSNEGQVRRSDFSVASTCGSCGGLQSQNFTCVEVRTPVQVPYICP